MTVGDVLLSHIVTCSIWCQ